MPKIRIPEDPNTFVALTDVDGEVWEGIITEVHDTYLILDPHDRIFEWFDIQKVSW